MGVDIARLSEATRLVDASAECQRGQRADTGYVRTPLLSHRKFSRCRLRRLSSCASSRGPFVRAGIQWWGEQSIAERQLGLPKIPTLVVDIARHDGSTESVPPPVAGDQAIQRNFAAATGPPA